MIKKGFMIFFTLYTVFRFDLQNFMILRWLIASVGFMVLFDNSFVKKIGILKKSFLYRIFFWCLVLLIAISAPVMHNTFDFSYSYQIGSFFVNLFRYILFVYVFVKLYGNEVSLELFFKLFVNTCACYVLISLFLIAFPEIKDFWFNNVIYMSELDKRLIQNIQYNYRISINGFAPFGYATMFGIALLINTYLLLSKKMKKKDYKYRIFTLIMIVIGCFLYGRVTIFAFALAILYVILFSPNKRRLIKLSVTVSLILFIGIGSLFSLSEMNEDIKTWMDWSFDVLSDVVTGEKISSASVNTVVDKMWFIPPLKTILLGDGYYESPYDGRYYMSTDVGFMRPMLFFGVFGLGLMYITFMSIVFLSKKQFEIEKNKQGVFLMWFILLLVFIFELKGEVVLGKLPLLCTFYFIKQAELYKKAEPYYFRKNIF